MNPAKLEKYYREIDAQIQRKDDEILWQKSRKPKPESKQVIPHQNQHSLEKGLMENYLGLDKFLIKNERFKNAVMSKVITDIKRSVKSGERLPFHSVFGIPLKMIEYEVSNQKTAQERDRNFKKSSADRFVKHLQKSDKNTYSIFINKYKDINICQKIPFRLGGKNEFANFILMPKLEQSVIRKIINTQEAAIQALSNGNDTNYISIPISDKMIYMKYSLNRHPEGYDFLHYFNDICRETINSNRFSKLRNSLTPKTAKSFEQEKTKEEKVQEISKRIITLKRTRVPNYNKDKRNAPLKNILKSYLNIDKKYANNHPFVTKVYHRLAIELEELIEKGEPLPFDTVLGLEFKAFNSAPVPKEKRETHKNNVRDNMPFSTFLNTICEDQENINKIESLLDKGILPAFHHKIPVYYGGSNAKTNLLVIPQDDHALLHWVTDSINPERINSSNKEYYFPYTKNTVFSGYSFNPNGKDFLNHLDNRFNEAIAKEEQRLAEKARRTAEVKQEKPQNLSYRQSSIDPCLLSVLSVWELSR